MTSGLPTGPFPRDRLPGPDPESRRASHSRLLPTPEPPTTVPLPIAAYRLVVPTGSPVVDSVILSFRAFRTILAFPRPLPVRIAFLDVLRPPVAALLQDSRIATCVWVAKQNREVRPAEVANYYLPILLSNGPAARPAKRCPWPQTVPIGVHPNRAPLNDSFLSNSIIALYLL